MIAHNINITEARPILVEFINEHVSDWDAFPTEIAWFEADDQDEEIVLGWDEYWQIIGSDQGDVSRPSHWVGELPCMQPPPTPSDELFQWAIDLGLIPPSNQGQRHDHHKEGH